ncbi:hypothetical protein HGA91_06235 [candidate division WWE3 bacterium]|nr:hypothetical protein [candidate division WWE3 bacterium]
MQHVSTFLKPTIKRVSVAIALELIIGVTSFYLVTKCFLADCMANGSLGPCCVIWEVWLTSVLFQWGWTSPFIAYLISCWLMKK